MPNEPIPAGATLGAPVTEATTIGEPIPQGATIGAPVAAKTEPIPQGATLGAPVKALTYVRDGQLVPPVGSNAPTQHTPPHTGSILGDAALGALSGVGAGVFETAEGVKNLVNKALPASAQIPDIPKEYRENVSTSEKVGGAMEDVGEFFAGDAALEGLAKATKMVELADKYPVVARTLKLAKDHPALAKLITGAGKSAVVGGVQGGVKGAAEGKAGEEATGGAVGGFVGGTAGEIASEVLGSLAKTGGVGTSAIEDATRGFKPAKRNVRFADNFQKAAPIIDAEPTWKSATDLKGKVDAIDTAREKWWQNQVQPWIDKHATAPLSGIAIKDGIEKAIPDTMKTFSPDKAAEVTQFANQFMPGQTNAQFQMTVGKAEDALEHFNAELAATGYWSKSASERAALEKVNPDIIKFKGAADAIRDELYGKLGTLEPTVDMRSLKSTYGSLRNVGDELRGQMNVQGRQAPVSLKQALGTITGIATGGWRGLGLAVLPALDRSANSSEALATRAVQKAAHPAATSAAEAGVSAARNLIEKGAPVAGAATGEYLGDVTTPTKPTRVIFQASDKTMHSIPIEQLAAARKIDPNLTVGQEF